MALAVTWGGFADTDLDFAEFFGNPHTVAVRFMLQYPHTVVGPMLSVNGMGTYILGKGDFSAMPLGQVRLLLQVGSVQVSPLAPLAAGTWHFLAVVRTGDSLQLFLDGSAVGAALTLPAGGLPSGTVRLGKTTFLTSDGGGNQFYGLLDDVAVFTQALTAIEIAALGNAAHLTGAEAGLHAGYVFGHVPPGGLPASLSRPLTSVGSASIVPVSANRVNSDDAARLPLPSTSLMHLPFPEEQEWFVIQGFDNQGGSHAGGASFCLDLMLAGKNQSESANVPFHSAAPGKVDTVKQDSVSGTGNISNFITVKQAPLEMCDYLHLAKSSSAVSVGDALGCGQKIAKVGDTGANVGAFHLHIAVTNLGEGHKGEGAFVTLPAPYTNYEASDDNGTTWTRVLRGVPRAGQRIRRPRASPETFIRGVLLAGRFRTKDELNRMSDDDRRNTLITELANRSNQPVTHFQRLDSSALAGAGAVLVFLREARIRDDATLKTMSDDDMRNTLIVETTFHSGLTVAQLQALSNVQLVQAGLGRGRSFIRGVLLAGRFRTKDELNGMSDDDQRNTLITELANRSNQPVAHFQGLDNTGLAGAGAVLVFLREARIRDDAALKTMSDDDMRNTLIVETAIHTRMPIADLQAMDSIHVAGAGLSDACR
ncbi:MAG TPA: LamG-like jellyroll fold domain-containing protein [Vicinamibacteria bacterium]